MVYLCGELKTNSMNRIEINRRFIEAFHILENKGIIVRNDRQKGLSMLAQKIFGNKQYGHQIGNILKKERNITYEAVTRFCDLYNVNEDYVLKGIGSPFGENKKRGQICYLRDQAAVAGDSVGTQARSEYAETFFSLPDLGGNGYLAFPVEGNSMEPRIFSGDLLICQPLEDFSQLKDNDIYTVVINERVFVKYIRKIYEEDEYGQKAVTKLKLISANYLEHDPFMEDVTPNTKIYKVVKRLQDFN